MARTFTVDELVTKCRLRGGYENSNRLTDAKWFDFLESALAELWDLLVTKYEDYYTTRSSPANFVVDQETYTLPGDFMKLLGIDVMVGGYWCGLRRFEVYERNNFQAGYPAGTWLDRAPYCYRIEGDSLFIAPIPKATDTYRFVYIKSSPKITSGAQTIDGINGWEELLVLFALRRAKGSQDEPVSWIDGEIARQTARIENVADARDAGQPTTIGDMPGEYW